MSPLPVLRSLRSSWVVLALGLLIGGCPAPSGDDDDSVGDDDDSAGDDDDSAAGDDDDSAAGDDDDDTPSTFTLPPSPWPLEVQLSWSEGPLMVEAVTCSYYASSGSFIQRVDITDTQNYFRLWIRSGFEGPGVYNDVDMNFQLVEYGGRFWQSLPSDGLSATIEGLGEASEGAYGSVEVGTLGSTTDGSMTIVGGAFPIWCPSYAD